MTTFAHKTAAFLVAFALIAVAGCQDHKETIAPPPPPEEDLGMNGFVEATQGSGNLNNRFPSDSITISMGANTHERFNRVDHILDVSAYISPAPFVVPFCDVGQVILSSAPVTATEIPTSDSSFFEYRLRGRVGFLQHPFIPQFGQNTQWKVPANNYGIPPLDTMLYTLAPLNVVMTGQEEWHGNDRVATTGSLSLSWDVDAQADWITVQVVYDGGDPINVGRNHPEDWRQYTAILPGNASGVIIPPGVLGKLPSGRALFEIAVRRQKSYLFPHGNMKSLLVASNNSLHTTIYTE